MSARLRGSDASAAVVDLTNDRSSPPAQATSLQMAESGASAGRKRSPRVSESTLGGDSKRARLDRDISAHGAHSVAVEADAAIDSIDLAEDDFEWEDSKLSHALRKQAEDAVKSQSQSKDASLTLANLTCLICMEMPPKDLTATSCGQFHRR